MFRPLNQQVIRVLRTGPLGVWARVALSLVALDVLLFHAGLFWKVTPDFGADLSSVTWQQAHAVARELETRQARPGLAVVAGSSVVLTGVSDAAVNAQLGRNGVAVETLRLAVFGATSTDSVLMLWQAMRLHPWLIIYGAAARDFKRDGYKDSPLIRTLYDSSIELPALARTGAEAQLDARVRRYWKLYRYRFFVRTAVATEATALRNKIDLPRYLWAAPAPEKERLPQEALQFFMASRVTPESFAVWQRWRQSRQFTDYLQWLRLSGSGDLVLNVYRTETLANYGPLKNPQVTSLEWLLDVMRSTHTRVLLVDFPENPAFHDPEAKPYYDESLSRAYADLLAGVAATYGARFADFRGLLDPEDFYDLYHPNLQGQRKLSARLASVIEEEWTAQQEKMGDTERR